MKKIELPRKKTVGHLTLLREPRTISPGEFNALVPAERMAIIGRARGMHKYNLLLEARDAEFLVRRMPAQEIFLLIKELGIEHAPELLELVTTEQFTAFLDLDCWMEDTLDPSAALQWLQLLLEGDEEKVYGTLRELDFELLSLMMKKFFTVTRGPEDAGDDEAVSGMAGGYEIEYHDAEGGKIVGLLFELLFKRDQPFAAQLLEAVRWEQEPLLEENVYHFRIGRMQDLGFPDPFDALVVFSPIDPAAFDPGRFRREGAISAGEGLEAPGFMLSAARPRDLLAEILAGGVSPEFCWELTFLLNKVMVADRVDVGDPLLVQRETEEVFCYLNLALEHLSGGDLNEAIRLTEEVYLEPLFRLGFGLTTQLQQRVAKVRKGALAPYLDGPFRALLDGLSRRRPRFFEGIENRDRGGERPFTSLHDLHLAGQWVERLLVQQRLFQETFPFRLVSPGDLDLKGCAPDDAEDLALSDVFLTALANRILGRDFRPDPIPREEIPVLHSRVCSDGGLNPDLRRETVQWLESLVPGGGAFGDYCLDLWQEEFCSLAPEDLDPRYVGGLIVRH